MNAKPGQIVAAQGLPPVAIGDFQSTPEWKLAESLAQSSFVPASMRGKPDDCLVAVDMAKRTGLAPMAILQNIYVVHGKPAWSSSFLIACVNASNIFATRLNWKYEGGECWAYAKDHQGEVYEGPRVSLEMAKAEGWYQKNGSKWKTMAPLMLRYRAATFFARCYCPELIMGLRTEDEVNDIVANEMRTTTVSSIIEEQIPMEIVANEMRTTTVSSIIEEQIPMEDAPVVEAQAKPEPPKVISADLMAASREVVQQALQLSSKDKVNEVLQAQGLIGEDQTYAHLDATGMQKVVEFSDRFIAACVGETGNDGADGEEEEEV